jgi:transcriptional regulator with GAF, ATPase, and Fis domain
MSLPFQRDMLRVVEYRTFDRVGGSGELEFDGRIVAATNADLPAMISQGEFLPDLYDRIAFEVIRVPPLYEREGDVELLAHYFLERFSSEVPALRGRLISDEALEQLREYRFPGNVRELKNLIERAVLRNTTQEITSEDIGLLPAEPARELESPFKQRIREFERKLVREALAEAKGNQAGAARLLGLPYHQMRYYAKKYGEA